MPSFVKPNNIRWVDMAIWCDANAYKPDCDNDTLYQYLYWLFWMLSHKWNYFTKESDYDEYSLLGASTVYFRLKNPKQFDGTRRLKYVKSVLNYVKTVAYPVCVTFQQQSYAQNFSIIDDKDKFDKLNHSLTQKVIHMHDDSMRDEFMDCLKKVTYQIKSLLKQLPYSSDKLITHNLYISCLLTILNYLSLDYVKLSRLNYRENKGMNNEYVLNELYASVRYQPALLFHLPESMSNYVSTLVNRVFAEVAGDLISIFGSYQPTDSIIKAVLSSPLEEYVEPNND